MESSTSNGPDAGCAADPRSIRGSGTVPGSALCRTGVRCWCAPPVRRPGLTGPRPWIGASDAVAQGCRPCWARWCAGPAGTYRSLRGGPRGSSPSPVPGRPSSRSSWGTPFAEPGTRSTMDRGSPGFRMWHTSGSAGHTPHTKAGSTPPHPSPSPLGADPKQPRRRRASAIGRESAGEEGPRA